MRILFLICFSFSCLAEIKPSIEKLDAYHINELEVFKFERRTKLESCDLYKILVVNVQLGFKYPKTSDWLEVTTYRLRLVNSKTQKKYSASYLENGNGLKNVEYGWKERFSGSDYRPGRPKASYRFIFVIPKATLQDNYELEIVDLKGKVKIGETRQKIDYKVTDPDGFKILSGVKKKKAYIPVEKKGMKSKLEFYNPHGRVAVITVKVKKYSYFSEPYIVGSKGEVCEILNERRIELFDDNKKVDKNHEHIELLVGLPSKTEAVDVYLQAVKYPRLELTEENNK